MNASCGARRGRQSGGLGSVGDMATPRMIQVTSSNIESIGYDDDTHELHVQFKGSGRYSYAGVPRALYSELLHTRSPGSFLHQQVIPTYTATKL